MWTSRLRLHCHRYALPAVSDEAVVEGLEGVEESISPASIAQGGRPPLLSSIFPTGVSLSVFMVPWRPLAWCMLPLLPFRALEEES